MCLFTLLLMKLNFKPHAQTQINYRNISIEDIKSVIRYPDNSYRTFGNRIVSQKNFTEGVLEVVYTTDGKKYIIITTYYL